jgi:hypothetical protein
VSGSFRSRFRDRFRRAARRSTSASVTRTGGESPRISVARRRTVCENSRSMVDQSFSGRQPPSGRRVTGPGAFARGHSGASSLVGAASAADLPMVRSGRDGGQSVGIPNVAANRSAVIGSTPRTTAAAFRVAPDTIRWRSFGSSSGRRTAVWATPRL